MASMIAQMVKNLPAMKETLVWFLGWEDLLEKGQAAHSSLLGFPCGSAGKESTCNVGDLDLISGLGRSPGEGKGYLLQDSGLENSMDCIAHGVAKSRTRLSCFRFHHASCRNLDVTPSWRLFLHPDLDLPFQPPKSPSSAFYSTFQNNFF